ncbi:tol-pal system protein YbgF [uncultured Nitrosomonas sp.]|uniref:tol-pal system protein YbgF n=1 Tax=uncultured Nitrosomonas sp. TaxID=156424 RepID=UPI002637A842|nr:tol-pal system protein YbgF [uncultured Nitrosomonas sp.]
MFLRAFLPLFLLLSCSMAQAALFSDSETREQLDVLRTKVTEMEARMQRTEEVLMGQALIELHTQAENLKDEMGKLRGQMEMLEEENRSLRKQLKDFYLDIDNRLRQIEPGSTGAPAPDSRGYAPPSESPAAEAKEIKSAESKKSTVILQLPDATQRGRYDAAYALIKGGDYSGAIAGFENFLVQYPRSALAPSAAYWIGNAHYASRNFDKAIAAQQRLLDVYPDSPKVPDGLLNMASSQIEIGQKMAARKILENLIANYPGTEAAAKARQRLVSLK